MVDAIKKYYQSLSVNEWLLLFFWVVFPFDKHAAVFVLYALSLSVLVTFKKEKLKQRFIENKALLLLPLLYILFLIRFAIEGKFTSEVEKKISLLVVPVLFVIARFNWRLIYFRALKVYLFSSILSLLSCLAIATYNFIQFNDSTYFFYDKLAFIHAGHYAMMLCLAFSIALYFIVFQVNTQREKILYSFSTFILALGLLLLTSKASLLAMVLISVLFLGLYIHKTRNFARAILVFISFLILSLSGYIFFPVLKNRVDTFASALFSKPQYAESTDLRKEIWNSAIDLIEDSAVLGYGSAANDLLFESYSKKHTSYEFQKKYNAHNTFLQIMLSVGVVGFLLLISIVGKALYNALKAKDFILLSYLIVLIAAFSTESMLETEAGILFFSMFYCFFMSSKEVGEIEGGLA
ncbi:MAG: O-antigen ligase family protein [Flavobacteriales bacterium]